MLSLLLLLKEFKILLKTIISAISPDQKSPPSVFPIAPELPIYAGLIVIVVEDVEFIYKFAKIEFAYVYLTLT